MNVKNATEDDATFRFLARRFAMLHTDMKDGLFPNGMINGADWYSVFGSAMSWLYPVRADFDLTIELDNTKKPPAADLPRQWSRVRTVFTRYPLIATLGGIRGRVVKVGTSTGLAATITIENSTTRVLSDAAAGGVFFRPVKPGTYELRITCTGYATLTSSVTVPTNLKGIEVLVQLVPAQSRSLSSKEAAATQPAPQRADVNASSPLLVSSIVEVPPHSSDLPAWDPALLVPDEEGGGQAKGSMANLATRPDI